MIREALREYAYWKILDETRKRDFPLIREKKTEDGGVKKQNSAQEVGTSASC